MCRARRNIFPSYRRSSSLNALASPRRACATIAASSSISIGLLLIALIANAVNLLYHNAKRRWVSDQDRVKFRPCRAHVTLKVPDMSSINVRLPDGSTQSVEPGTRPIDVARSISPRLADAAIVAKVNGEMYDLT